MKKYYIDAGHGNIIGGVADPGACVGKAQEAEIVLAVAKLLQTELERQGIATRMSRTGASVKKDVYARAEEANKWGADCFVSLHCNAYNGTADGTETLICGWGGRAEKLAEKVQAALVKALGTEDRKVKERPELVVLNHTDMPAILCELAFIDNAFDRAKLLGKAYQKKAAVAICKAICDYEGIAYQEEVKKMEFKDQKEISGWALEYVEKVAEAGIMIGDDQGNFNPKDPVTREQLAVVIAKVKGL